MLYRRILLDHIADELGPYQFMSRADREAAPPSSSTHRGPRRTGPLSDNEIIMHNRCTPREARHPASNSKRLGFVEAAARFRRLVASGRRDV